MNIELKSLKIKNFKGIKNFNINFSNITNIFGENATGKSTIFDGFTWLLFDKDSQDRSKFDVQPLDENNNVVHMLETEVEAFLDIEGKEIRLKKILKEKWVKKRGEVESELKGTETSYYIDEVPTKMNEYKKKINEIIDENIFKLITNPLYFSTNMKWQDRREIILKIVGDITNEKIVSSNEELTKLKDFSNTDSIDELKKVTAAKKKKLTEDKKSIPYRVDELNNSIEEHDFEAIEFQKRSLLSAINSIESKILDGNKVNEEKLQYQNEIYKLKSKLKEIEFSEMKNAEKPKIELHNKLEWEVKSKLASLNSDLNSTKREFQNNTLISEKLQKELVDLRVKFEEVQKAPFELDESKFICPTCKRPLDIENIEALKQELSENHNQNISKQLANINLEGKRKKEELNKYEDRLLKNNELISSLDSEIKEYTALKVELEEKLSNFTIEIDLDSNEEYQKLLLEIKELEDKINEPVERDQDIHQLMNKKINLQIDLEGINNQLAAKENNEKVKNRINELLEDEKKLAQQIADLEKTEYLCEEFIKTKVNLLEQSINDKFKYVKFKLFDVQVNGGINECCEALIDGVPFSNANTASQYNAGLDIINALSNFYDVQAPIFIDNRESVNSLIDTNSQIINLIVSKDKPLRIESGV
ncbi:AAA family ATPase [Clostridium sp. 'White wine YQ']|uniref:AAA family ATPase n=1 Tax=Clostridium sp. 'White wine YQ' TaxID=3027474 RepID=UPI0023670A2E|nr:AAA family ATPase [Clostridium sp. 'White wine YQ']MDD7793668.1 AAA family ATPase [Clostridium sp. 'White wine YQ']